MAFHVGQKVKCVARGTWVHPRSLGLVVPETGLIYTVRECVYYGAPGIRLAEIRNAPMLYEDGFIENAWALVATDGHPDFLPITDISIFHEILKKASKDIEAGMVLPF